MYPLQRRKHHLPNVLQSFYLIFNIEEEKKKDPAPAKEEEEGVKLEAEVEQEVI